MLTQIILEKKVALDKNKSYLLGGKYFWAANFGIYITKSLKTIIFFLWSLYIICISRHKNPHNTKAKLHLHPGWNSSHLVEMNVLFVSSRTGQKEKQICWQLLYKCMWGKHVSLTYKQIINQSKTRCVPISTWLSYQIHCNNTGNVMVVKGGNRTFFSLSNLQIKTLYTSNS